MELDFNELSELLTVLNQTDITELTLKSGDFELTVRKGTSMNLRISEAVPSGLGSEAESPMWSAAPPTVAVPPVSPSYGREPIPGGMAGSTAAAPPPTASPPQVDPKWVAIKSPIVGTFYRAPGPDEPPFVQVGDRIRVGQTVCIIEAMKVMNEIVAEVSGQVMEILVQNGEPIEYEQTLMRINPES